MKKRHIWMYHISRFEAKDRELMVDHDHKLLHLGLELKILLELLNCFSLFMTYRISRGYSIFQEATALCTYL